MTFYFPTLKKVAVQVITPRQRAHITLAGGYKQLKNKNTLKEKRGGDTRPGKKGKKGAKLDQQGAQLRHKKGREKESTQAT